MTDKYADESDQIEALTSGQRLRMRKTGSCKGQILETRMDHTRLFLKREVI